MRLLRILVLRGRGRRREVGRDLSVEVVRGAARGGRGRVEAGADTWARPEGRLVLRVEDLDGALLSDPVAHLGSDGTIISTFHSEYGISRILSKL